LAVTVVGIFPIIENLPLWSGVITGLGESVAFWQTNQGNKIKKHQYFITESLPLFLSGVK